MINEGIKMSYSNELLKLHADKGVVDLFERLINRIESLEEQIDNIKSVLADEFRD